MPTSITTFLTKVAMEPKTSIAFNADPAAAVHASPMTAVAKAAVLSRDPKAIRDAILVERGIAPGAAVAAGDTEVVIVVII